MTFRQQFASELEGNGMFPDQAARVLVRYLDGPLGQSMLGRFDDEVSAYPPAIVGVVRMGIKQVALEYIDETMPEAWFRPVFA
jgi:hypothetical protein